MMYGTCGQVMRKIFEKKKFFFASLNSMKKGIGGTDPGIRIRTKMSRIPNTVAHKEKITDSLENVYSWVSD
jgi:hypothetical protein